MNSLPATERISSTELFSLMTLFLIGSTIILPKGTIAGHDAWISVMLTTLGGGLVAWLYVYLFSSSARSLLDLGEQLLGTWGGRGVALLYAWYSFHLGTLVLKNVEQLTVTVLLPLTPNLVIDLTLMCLVVWAVQEGIEVIGRCSLMIFGVFCLFLLVTSLLMLPDMEFEHLLPLVDLGWPPVLEAATKITTFPFGESILFAMVLPVLNKKQQGRKTVFWSVGVAGFFLLIDDLRNTMIFSDLTADVHFPSYTSVSFISIADFLERIEPFGYLVWLFAGFVKISVCLHVTSLCIALLMIELAQFIYKSQAEMFQFAEEVWAWYSLPFQVGVPLVLLAFYMVRKKHLHLAK
jgi:spore germination protein KB